MKTAPPILSASPAAEALESGSVMMTVTGALVLIILLMVALAWVVRRTGITRRLNDSAGAMTLVASKSLGARERLVLVDVGEQRLVLGVTATQITCLSTQTKPISEAMAVTSVTASFPAMLEAMREKYRQGKK